MSISIAPQLITEIYHLLKQAVQSSDSKSQAEVFSKVTKAEQNPMFYIGLITIASNKNVQEIIRQMALLTLKTTLKRNAESIYFSQEQFEYMRQWTIKIESDYSGLLGKGKKLLVSVLAMWDRKLDFGILNYLLQKLVESEKSCNWSLDTLKIVFQDLRFQTENINCFEKPQFLLFLQAYFKIFSDLIKNTNNEITNKLLTCTNLLIKYSSYLQANNQIVQEYISNYLIPILSNSNAPNHMLETVLQGFSQTLQINSTFVKQLALESIVQFNSENNNVMKKWLSLIYQLLDKGRQQSNNGKYFPTLIPKILKSLIFTRQDQLNVKLEMEQQDNPYEYENQESEDGDGDKSGFYSYTKRKLAVLILKQMFSWQSDQAWHFCEGYMKQLLSSHLPLQRQCGVLMVGIIFQVMEDHLQFLQLSIPIIMSHINQISLPDILRCTSIWSLSKLAYLIIRQKQLNLQIQSQLVKCLKTSNGQVADAAYCTVDEFIRLCQELPPFLNQLVLCIINGIKTCQGKSLFSTLKICSTLYDRHNKNISEQITQMIIKQLCSKWSVSHQTESVMSPILECLVTICSSNKQTVKKYAFDIFRQCFQILDRENQKALVLRAIDLTSSLISVENNEIKGVISQNQEFHRKINQLLKNSENQIRNFTMGLIGDICKITTFPQYAEAHIEEIGSSFNENNLTSCCNTLTCLTDIIFTHPYLGAKYSKNVFIICAKKIQINNLHPSYGFNFARAFGRLGNISPQEGSLLLGQVLHLICTFLKAHEHHKLTNDSYRGIFKMIRCNPQAGFKPLDYLAEAFICYPSQEPELENQFKEILKQFRKQLGPQWENFLKSPIFLPAIAKKVNSLSS